MLGVDRILLLHLDQPLLPFSITSTAQPHARQSVHHMDLRPTLELTAP